ncbi:MAG: serine/threonine protein kinase [Alphaproteobacteria bacterium]|nr:serine/threonine protein kinase [Alphaproteobacteria bacterium]
MSDLAAPTLADGRYTLVRQLGEGGMATVFLAWDNKLKVWRAVKALLPDFVRKAKVRRRFENEAHAMARLEHPHIIRVYDVGVQDGSPYMVMELARGGCVIDWLEEHGPMPPQLAAEVTIQISQGLHAAHEAGIVHRDVKPHNILVTHKGVCKMTDFGIAQVMENDSLTKTGSVMGTWGYMAPEQRTDAKSVDERADIFGLGATLYSMLTSKTPTELYVADEEDDVFAGVPPAMLEVILKACSYKAAQRYDNVKAFARAVRDAAASCPPTPEGTPDLILPSEPLPESVESVELTQEQILELQRMLGLDHVPEEEPTVHDRRADDRILPYYTPEPMEPGGPPAPALEPQRELTPAELANFITEELPSFVDMDAFGTDLTPALPEAAEEPSDYVDPEPAPEPESPVDDAEEEEEEPAPRVPRKLTAADIALRAAVVPLLLGIALVMVIGWGMVKVNGAHDEARIASRPLHALLTEEVQGPIIDGLALTGADKAQLEGALATYRTTEADRMAAARAYVRLVEADARRAGDSPIVRSIAPGIDDLHNAESQYASAEADWARTSGGFPGVLAVTLGLAQSP